MHSPSDPKTWEQLHETFASGGHSCLGHTDDNGDDYQMMDGSDGEEGDPLACYEADIPIAHWCDGCRGWWAICEGQTLAQLKGQQ